MQPRIVSLLPSATEIVCALGFGHWLVGRSHECDFPPEVQGLPVCTRARLDAQSSSAKIDEEVKHLLWNALSIYEVQSETIAGLKPDFVLTQAQCEVCAVSLKEIHAALTQWGNSHPKLVSLSPMRLADVWENIFEVARVLGAEARGVELVAQLQARMRGRRLENRCPRVVCIEWIDPMMAAGNWVPELVALAGGRDLLGSAGRHSQWMTWETLRRADPEVLILMPCGFDLERTRREAGVLTQNAEWAKLRAVESGRVFVTDGGQFFNRPGPRLAESLEILVEILNPEQRRFGYQMKHWDLLLPGVPRER